MYTLKWNDRDFLEGEYSSVWIRVPTQANITTETPRHQKIGSNPQTKADIILQRAKPLDPSTFLCFVLSDICLLL